MTKEQSKSESDAPAVLKDSGRLILNEDLDQKTTIAQHFEPPTESVPSDTGKDKKKE